MLELEPVKNTSVRNKLLTIDSPEIGGVSMALLRSLLA